MPAKPAAVKPTALTSKSKPRERRFRENGARVNVTDTTYVVRGFRVGAGADADEHLVYVNGDRELAMPLPLIGAAIVGKLISDTEIKACQELR